MASAIQIFQAIPTMNSKLKIRFTVLADDREVELFSVHERKSGELLIAGKRPMFYEENGRSFIYKEQHYSVHRSNFDNDTTITQKTIFEGGVSQSIVSFIPNTKDFLLWNIYTRRFPRVISDNPNVSARAGDRVLCVGKFLQAEDTFIYSLFVSRNEFTLPPSEAVSARSFSMPFSHFKIILLISYLNIPAMRKGMLRLMSTSTKELNGARDENHFQISSRSLALPEFLNGHITNLNLLHEEMICNAQEELKNHPGILPIVSDIFDRAMYYSLSTRERRDDSTRQCDFLNRSGI